MEVEQSRSFDDLVLEQGFDSTEEFNSLVAAVDLTNPRQKEAFLSWKEEDGSKEGLLDVLEVE